jgi:hypothetical protein
MREIQIEYIIDETHKEIYGFTERGDNTYYYDSISYASRNDEDDIWGDEWREYYSEKMTEELEKYAKLQGYEDFADLPRITGGDDIHYYEVRNIRNKYNPSIQKTIYGEQYLHGRSVHGFIKLPEPKMTTEEIKNAILQKITDIKVDLEYYK